jgi:hypothetical protein
LDDIMMVRLWRGRERGREIGRSPLVQAEFHAEVRDGSLEHVSKLISQMHRDCRAGNTARVESFVASTLPAKPEAPTMSESDAEDGTDDEGDGDDEVRVLCVCVCVRVCVCVCVCVYVCVLGRCGLWRC